MYKFLSLQSILHVLGDLFERVSQGAKLKKVEDNWSVKATSINLCILIAEVVLMTVWAAFFQISGNTMGCYRHPVLF